MAVEQHVQVPEGQISGKNPCVCVRGKPQACFDPRVLLVGCPTKPSLRQGPRVALTEVHTGGAKPARLCLASLPKRKSGSPQGSASWVGSASLGATSGWCSASWTASAPASDCSRKASDSSPTWRASGESAAAAPHAQCTDQKRMEQAHFDQRNGVPAQASTRKSSSRPGPADHGAANLQGMHADIIPRLLPRRAKTTAVGARWRVVENPLEGGGLGGLGGQRRPDPLHLCAPRQESSTISSASDRQDRNQPTLPTTS